MSSPQDLTLLRALDPFDEAFSSKDGRLPHIRDSTNTLEAKKTIFAQHKHGFENPGIQELESVCNGVFDKYSEIFDLLYGYREGLASDEKNTGIAHGLRNALESQIKAFLSAGERRTCNRFFP